MSNSSNDTIKITIGGAARSGSTYLRYLLVSQYNSKKIDISKTHLDSDHLDRIQNQNLDEIWIIPVREPKSCVKSILAWEIFNKNKEKLSDPKNIKNIALGVLDRVTNLWETILLDKKKFIFLDFNVLTLDRKNLENFLEKNIPNLSNIKNEIYVSDQEIKNSLELEDKNIYRDNKNKYLALGHLPRELPDDIKNIVKEYDKEYYNRRFKYLEELKKELLGDS